MRRGLEQLALNPATPQLCGFEPQKCAAIYGPIQNAAPSRLLEHYIWMYFYGKTAIIERTMRVLLRTSQLQIPEGNWQKARETA